MQTTALNDLMTLREIAAHLGASYPHAWRLAASGQLGKPTIVGATHLYSRALVEATPARRKAS